MTTSACKQAVRAYCASLAVDATSGSIYVPFQCFTDVPAYLEYQTSDKMMVIHFSLDSSKIALLAFPRLRWETVFRLSIFLGMRHQRDHQRLAAEQH
jgi:hypothetical protein